MRFQQKLWEVRSLDTDLAPADPMVRAGAAQRVQTIKAEGKQSIHFIPKGTGSPERYTGTLAHWRG